MSDELKAIDPVNNFLAQYGVPGMKWGRRKSRGPSSVRVKTTDGKLAGTATAAPGVSKRQLKKAVKNDPDLQLVRGKTTSGTTSKPRNTLSNNPKNRRMTDAELRAKVNRLQMEKQLADLSKSTKGENFVKGLLKDTGKQIARDVTKSLARAAISVAIEKAAGKAVAGSTNQLLLQAMANSGGGKKKAPKTP